MKFGHVVKIDESSVDVSFGSVLLHDYNFKRPKTDLKLQILITVPKVAELMRNVT